MSYTVGYGEKVISGKESAAVAGRAEPKTFFARGQRVSKLRTAGHLVGMIN
jgi:hypothetical protein